MDEIVIRDASEADATRFAEIYAPYVRGTVVSFEDAAPDAAGMAARLADKRAHGYPWLALEVAGRVAGYAYYGSWRSREAYAATVETSIYLDPACQGRGLGARFYGVLLDRARAEGRRAAIGVIALPNPASEALHERLGFRRVGVYREVGRKLGRWVDVSSWELLL